MEPRSAQFAELAELAHLAEPAITDGLRRIEVPRRHGPVGVGSRQGRGSQGSRPGSRRLSAGTRRANSADFLAEPGTPELGRRKPRFVRLSFDTARGKEIQARLDEKHAAEAKATGSYKNRRASAPATVLKPLPEEGTGRRSRRRSLGTLVTKKTEVKAEDGEMVRKGKKGAAPPPPVKHSFEWE